MSAVFTLQIVEADGRMVGYVMHDGAFLCLLCGTSWGTRETFDEHLGRSHNDEG